MNDVRILMNGTSFISSCMQVGLPVDTNTTGLFSPAKLCVPGARVPMPMPMPM